MNYKISIAPMTNDHEYVVLAHRDEWLALLSEAAKVREHRGWVATVRQQLTEEPVQRMTLSKESAEKLFVFAGIAW